MDLSKRLIAPISEEQDNAIKEFCRNANDIGKAELARVFIDLISGLDAESAGIIVFDKNNIRLFTPGEDIQNLNKEYSHCAIDIQYDETNNVNVNTTCTKKIIKK